MNKKEQLIIYIVVVIIGLAISGFALWGGQTKTYSQKSPDYLAWKLLHGFRIANKPLYGGTTILQLKEKLNLTPKQEQKIEDIMIAYREDEIRKSAEIKIKELRLASYLGSEKIDKKEMARHIQEISKEKTDWVVSYVNYLLDIRDVLTPAQRELLPDKEERSTGNRHHNRQYTK